MRNGKIPEKVLKRSILREIKSHRKELMRGAEVGGNCAYYALGGSKGTIALSTQTFTLPVKNAAYLAVMSACNNLAVEGGAAAVVMLSVVLPREAPEEQLKEIMKQAERCCEELQVQIAGGHTEVSSSVKCPVITATAVGELVDPLFGLKCATYNMDIVMSKWIGLEGTAILASARQKELLERFPRQLVEKAVKCGEYLSIEPEATIARRYDAYTTYDIRNGGIFGALWEMSQRIGAGLSVNLREIPVKQETIEICEYYGLNPYEFLSGGALLMVTRNGWGLKAELEAAGIPATVIGRTFEENDKIVVNGDETRYLTMPAADEIYKIFFKEEDR